MRTHFLKLIPTHWLGLALAGLMSWSVPSLWLSLPDPSKIHWGVGMGVAFILMLLALVPAGRSEKSPWEPVFCYSLNALGTGCAVGTLLAQLEEIPDLQLLLICLVPGAVLALVLAFSLAHPPIQWVKRICWIAAAISLVLVGVGICRWCFGDALWGAVCFFCGLVLLPFSVVCRTCAQKPEYALGHLALAGFGIFFVVFFIVLLILSEGDILDGLDFDLPSRKKKTPKS